MNYENIDFENYDYQSAINQIEFRRVKPEDYIMDSSVKMIGFHTEGNVELLVNPCDNGWYVEIYQGEPGTSEFRGLALHLDEEYQVDEIYAEL